MGSNIIAGRPTIRKVARYEGNEGITHRGILDLAKQGTRLMPLDFYRENRAEIVRGFLDCFPLASDIHGSTAPINKTFREANQTYWPEYEGYHVSRDKRTGERILFPLPKTLPDADGKEISVWDAKNSIVLVRIGNVDGKPAIEYEYDGKKGETLLHLNTSEILCAPAPRTFEHYEWKDGVFVKSDSSNYENAYSMAMHEHKNWNGIAAIGGGCIGHCFGIGMNLVFNYDPSLPLGVLAIDKADESEAKRNRPLGWVQSLFRKP